MRFHSSARQVYHGTEGLHNMLGSAYYVAPEVIREGQVAELQSTVTGLIRHHRSHHCQSNTLNAPKCQVRSYFRPTWESVSTHSMFLPPFHVIFGCVPESYPVTDPLDFRPSIRRSYGTGQGVWAQMRRLESGGGVLHDAHGRGNSDSRAIMVP
jgi:hypothetical protein